MDKNAINVLQIWNDYTQAPKEKAANVKHIYPLRPWRVSEDKVSPVRELDEQFLQTHKKSDFGILVTTAQDTIQAMTFSPQFLYLPGEVCRQSDILMAAASHAIPLFIERGNFLAPPDILRMLDKIKHADVRLVECGSAFGYQNNVLDPRIFYYLQKSQRQYGLNLSSVFVPQEAKYPHHPKWLHNLDLLPFLEKCGLNFGCSFFVMEKNLYDVNGWIK